MQSGGGGSRQGEAGVPAAPPAGEGHYATRFTEGEAGREGEDVRGSQRKKKREADKGVRGEARGAR